MPKTSDHRRHWRRLPAWPACDRALWLAGTAPARLLDLPSYGRTLRPDSLATIERAWGRYLAWLDHAGMPQSEAAPEARVTPARVAAYLRHLEALGYSGQTRLLLLSGLRCALRILAPAVDTRWVTRPNGHSILASFRAAPKPVAVPHVADLYRWGLELTVAGGAPEGSRQRLLAFRDGVLIALLAARPLRRRTMAGLRLGQQLVRAGDGWRLVLEAADMKNRRVLGTPFPRSLNAVMDDYLARVRPRLPGSHDGAAVWLEADGTAMTAQAITRMVYRRSAVRFGIRFGPHRFRHATGTWAPLEDPAHPGLAATMLAVGTGMARQHYDRSDAAVAATAFHDALAAERAALEPLARQLFAAHAAATDEDDGS
jgi:site-specific recombinase XerD